MLNIPLRSRTRSLRRFARQYFRLCRQHGQDPNARQTLDLFLVCAFYRLDQ